MYRHVAIAINGMGLPVYPAEGLAPPCQRGVEQELIVGELVLLTLAAALICGSTYYDM